MVSLVDFLFESARKLLHWLNQDLETLSIDLESLCERICLSINHSDRSDNKIVLELFLEDINFARSLVELLKSTFTFAILSLHRSLRNLQLLLYHFDCFNTRTKVFFQPFHFFLHSGMISSSLNFVHFLHDLPLECLVEFTNKCLHFIRIFGKRILGHHNH